MTDAIKPQITVGQLFDRAFDGRWGLQGDPYVWVMLHEYLREVAMPDASAKLEMLLVGAFEQVTGYSLAKQEPFYLPIVASRTHTLAAFVSTHWWRHTGLPVLIDRAYALRCFPEVAIHVDVPVQVIEMVRLSRLRPAEAG